MKNKCKHIVAILKTFISLNKQTQSNEDEIYNFEDDFFETYFSGKEPMKMFRLGCFSTVSWSDNYIKFNGYGNLESMNDYEAVNSIDEAALITWLMENK